MWIIIAGLVFSFLFILFYSINGSSAIIIDKKNYRIIIADESPSSVIKFTDLIKVDLMVNGTGTIVPDVKAKRKFIKKAGSVCLKFTIAHNDKPVYVNFINNEKNKNNSKYKNAGKKR